MSSPRARIVRADQRGMTSYSPTNGPVCTPSTSERQDGRRRRRVKAHPAWIWIAITPMYQISMTSEIGNQSTIGIPPA